MANSQTPGSLPPPPRFGTGGTDFPKSISEISQFIRWLVSLWRKADNSTTDQQVAAYIPESSGSKIGVALQEAIAVGMFGQGVRLPVQQGPQRPPARFRLGQAPNQSNLENVANLALMLAMRPQPTTIPPSQTGPQYGVGLEGTHNDRISLGTGTIAGNTLTGTGGTDPPFSVGWVGSQISINGSLFSITAWTSGTIITLDGTPPAGAIGWEFMLYPANLFPLGSTFIETDRTVTYRNGLSNGTANVSGTTLTWLTGPKFSPYWQGVPITVNGVGYTIVGATQTTLILSASAGVHAGIAWSIAVASTWYYDTGLMTGNHAATPTDLDPYTDLGFLYRDATRLVTYQGVNNASVGFYFRWLEGTEFMSLATCLGRTFRAEDNGYQVWISDFGHLIVWSGSAFGWGPGDEGSGQIVMAPGFAPQGGPWAFCDGSAANILKIIAGVPTSVSVTTPDMRSDTFVRGGTYTGVADPTSSPTFSGAGLTFTGTPATLTGTNTAPAFTGAAGTPTGSFAGSALGNHTHDAPVGSVSATIGFMTAAFGTGTTQTRSVDFTTSSSAGSQAVFKTGPTSAGTPAGSITISPFTPSGTVAAPVLTMNSYTPAGTIGGTGAVGAPTVGSGAPKSMALLFYMRQ